MKALEMMELRVKELKMKELKVKELGMKELEVKEIEMRELEIEWKWVINERVKELEMKDLKGIRSERYRREGAIRQEVTNDYWIYFVPVRNK